jgi:hypothetical protein
LLHGAQVQMPPAHGTFKQAQKVKKDEGLQAGRGLQLPPIARNTLDKM